MKKIKLLVLAFLMAIGTLTLFACGESGAEKYTFVEFKNFKTEYVVEEPISASNSELVLKNSSGDTVIVAAGDYTIDGELATDEVGNFQVTISYKGFEYVLRYSVKAEVYTFVSLTNFQESYVIGDSISLENSTLTLRGSRANTIVLPAGEYAVVGTLSTQNVGEYSVKLTYKDYEYVLNYTVVPETYTFVSLSNFKPQYLVGESISMATSVLTLTNSKGKTVVVAPGQYTIEGTLSTKEIGNFSVTIKYDSFVYVLNYSVVPEGYDEFVKFVEEKLNNLFTTGEEFTLDLTPDVTAKFLKDSTTLKTNEPLVLNRAFVANMLKSKDTYDPMVAFVKQGLEVSDEKAKEIVDKLIAAATGTGTFKEAAESAYFGTRMEEYVANIIIKEFCDAFSISQSTENREIIKANFVTPLMNMLTQDGKFTDKKFTYSGFLTILYATADRLSIATNDNLKNLLFSIANDTSDKPLFDKALKAIKEGTDFDGLVCDGLEDVLGETFSSEERTAISNIKQVIVEYFEDTKTLDDVKTAVKNYVNTYKSEYNGYVTLLEQAIDQLQSIKDAYLSEDKNELPNAVSECIEWLETNFSLRFQPELKAVVNGIAVSRLQISEMVKYADKHLNLKEFIARQFISVNRHYSFASDSKAYVVENFSTPVVNMLIAEDYDYVLMLDYYLACVNHFSGLISSDFNRIVSEIRGNISKKPMAMIEAVLNAEIGRILTYSKDGIFAYIASFSKATDKAAVQREIAAIYDLIVAEQYEEAFNKASALLESSYSRDEALVVKSLAAIALVAVTDFEDVDLNKVFSFITLPEGVSVDFNILYTKLKDSLNNKNIVKIERISSEMVTVDGVQSKKYYATIKIDLDIEIASILGTIEIGIN